MDIPKQLKPKNPFLTLQPLYTNPTTGLGFKTASMELGLQGNYGKKKEWTLKPHIGYNYTAPAGKSPLSGGLDASYRGMANPSHTANAIVNLGAGYNPSSRFGAVAGFDAGYQFNFGAKNRRKGEIKPGKFAGSVMPYGGANSENGLIYGGRGEFEWRPKFGNKAPFTVYGGANLNFAPVTGKEKEVTDTGTVYQEGDVSEWGSTITPGAFKDNSSEGVRAKGTLGANLGIKISLAGKKFPSIKNKTLPYPEDPLPLQGDTTYAQRLPELTPGGKSLLGTYDETADEFRARRNEWGKPILKVDPRFIDQDIRTNELQEFPWQNKSYIPTEDNDDGYALGGTIRTMAEGGSGCREGYIWDGKNCIKQWGPITTAKKESSNSVSKENADIKNLMEAGKKSLPKTQIAIKSTQPQNIPFKGDVTNDILNNYIYNHKDQVGDNVAEFFDASGSTSWDDAYRAKQAWNQSGNSTPTLEQSVNMFGAVPILGKLSKLKYMSSAPDAFKAAYKYFPWQEALNKSDAVKDTYDDNIKKYGGSLNIMANGGDPKTTRTLFQPGTYNPNEMIGGMVNLPAATKTAEAPMWVEFANEYEKKNPKQAFIDGKKRDYLKQNRNLNAMAGNNMDYFPEKTAQNFADEYNYKRNNYIAKKLGKEKDFNPRKRGEWVAELSPGERKVIEHSRYGSKLQPSLIDRTIVGMAKIASPWSPELQQALADGEIIPGVTKNETREINKANIYGIPTGGLEAFSIIDTPGAWLANRAKNNAGLSTGANYKEMPIDHSELMSNVSPTDAMVLNPLNIIAAPELGINTAKIGAKVLKAGYKGAKATVKATAKTYNKVATGNSRLTDFNFPAWKLEKPTGSMSGATENSRIYIAKTNTDRGAELLSKFGKGMNLTPEEWAEMEALTKSGATDFSKSDIPISRIPLYYNRSERAVAEAEALSKLRLWQKFSTPSEKSIRTWSAGIPEGYSPERLARSRPIEKTRIVIPSRYTKGLGDDFAAMHYDDTRIDFIHPKKDAFRGLIKAGSFNYNASLENELIGNIPEGFMKIGSSKEGGYNNLIVKPIKKQYGGSLAPNIPTYYQSQGTPIYRDTTALPFATGGDLDGLGDPIPGKPKLPKLSTNDMTAYIYDTVVKLIEEAKASGKIKEGENLNAMGVTAQILLESGNGKSGLTQKYNNFGGIKANDSYIKRGGKYVGMNASGETTKSKWRIYDTPEEGLRDQISFYLDNPRYRKAGVLTAQSAQEHAQRVQNAGYAGNEKKYARQVMQMANSIPNRIKKSDPAKLQTFVTSYAPAQPAVNPIMPVQPMQPVVPIAPPVQPVQPMNAASIPIAPQVAPTPAAVTIPGGTVTNSALQAQTVANNAMMASTLNNVANSNINSNVASQQNPSYPITTEEDSTSPQLAQYLNYSPAYPQWPGIDVDFDMARSKSFNLPKMNKPSRWDHLPMFKKGRSTQLAFPVISDIDATQYPSPISKIVQGVTGYNPNYYENTFDEEGNLVQGELERAKEEGRPVEFQKGYSSIQDIFNRRAYNKQLEQMQPAPIVPATIEKAGGGFLASGYGSSLDEYYANGGHMDYSMYDVFENGTYYGKGGQMIKINQKKYGGPLSRFYPSNIQEY